MIKIPILSMFVGTSDILSLQYEIFGLFVLKKKSICRWPSSENNYYAIALPAPSSSDNDSSLTTAPRKRYSLILIWVGIFVYRSYRTELFDQQSVQRPLEWILRPQWLLREQFFQEIGNYERFWYHFPFILQDGNRSTGIPFQKKLWFLVQAAVDDFWSSSQVGYKNRNNISGVIDQIGR